MSNPFFEKDMRMSLPSKHESLSPPSFAKLSAQNDVDYSFKFRSCSLTDSLSLANSLASSPNKEKDHKALKAAAAAADEIDSPNSDLYTKSDAYDSYLPQPSPQSNIMNYSPKHSRKPSSLSNRNMKKLSLNLINPSNYTTARILSPTANSSYNDDESTRTVDGSEKSQNSRISSLVCDGINSDAIPSDLSAKIHSIAANTSPFSSPSIPSPPKLKPPSITTSTTNITSPALKTPAITSTPTLPPLLQKPQKKGLNIDDSQIVFNMNTPHILQSPLRSDKTVNYSQSLNSPPLITKFPSRLTEAPFTSIDGSPHFFASPEAICTTTTIKSVIPEELQELNQLNAYPTGPRNVLNNQIFLYSDPLGMVDINQFDLIVNVARECEDLSLKLVRQLPGSKQYMHIPWTHTSSISKELPLIIKQIDHFYNKGLKILIHCQCGVSRLACVIVAYFMFKFKLGVNDAYELLKLGTDLPINKAIYDLGYTVETCDRICPNMSLIFELMEFAEKLNDREIT